MSQVLSEALWLGEQALTGLVGLWEVTIPVLTFVLIAWMLHRRRSSSLLPLSMRQGSVLIVPLLIGIVILLWGAVFRVEKGSIELLTAWPVRMVYVFLGIQVIASAVIVWMCAGRRVLVLSVLVLVGWLSLLFAWLAAMAVTGNWL
jgi:hypothetical protein